MCNTHMQSTGGAPCAVCRQFLFLERRTPPQLNLQNGIFTPKLAESRVVRQSEIELGRLVRIDVEKSASHQQSQAEIASDNPCWLNRSMQHSSNLLISLFEKHNGGCTQLNLDRAVFSLNQRSRRNLAVETPADWTSGRCCVDPLRPPGLSLAILV